MTVAIGTMLPEIRVELPGIPTPILNAALYRVIRQFFWDSEAWKYTYDNGLDWTISTIDLPLPTAGLDIPAKCVVKRVDTVMYDSGGTSWDQEVPFKTRDELDRLNRDWYTETGSSPSYWTHGNDGAAIVVPIASATVSTAFLIRSVIAPVFTVVTDTLPDFLYYEFEEAIKSGVLAQCMKIPGKDWTDMNAAQFYAQGYIAGTEKAKSRAQADFGQPKDTMAYGGI
jgi:hypothetical protein